MRFLIDVTRKHEFQNRQKTLRFDHLLHPFTNSIGEHKDKYEILRSLERGKKRSAHVSYVQLAEMFAHDFFIQFNIRIRMKDLSGSYPSSPPGIRPQHDDVISGSNFEKKFLMLIIGPRYRKN